ncbi:MAG: ACP synthase [Candidatus Pelagibacter sp.]|jgi:holo-[acyl-carrier protein] synthase|nr:ACP synthase [Candidatus Pelagibacter sp.]MDP7541557.1 holo-ACP synthase [Candidatus Pelagibacter bacterium]|tara:strand:+ start:338 stop:724 length:387 start_codon:yes stop_codon:yes gene_type:complete
MKILGIGVDIIENSRIKNAIKKKLFVNRIFSKVEISNSKKVKNKTNFFAKRFAAKEAFVKSIGTGIRKDINFKNIYVTNDKSGKPNIKFTNKVKNLMIKKFKTKAYNLFLSLSDEKNYSIAFVIIQKK